MWHWAPCLTSFSLARAHTLISHPACLLQGPCCFEGRTLLQGPCPAQLLSGSEHLMCLYLTPPATSTTSRAPSPPLVIFMLSIYFFRGFACWILDYQCGGPNLERHCPGSPHSSGFTEPCSGMDGGQNVNLVSRQTQDSDLGFVRYLW